MNTQTQTLPSSLGLDKISSKFLMPGAHWFLRVPLAVIMYDQGQQKLPGLAEQAAANDLPVIMFALAALAEIGGAFGLIVGGVLQSLNLGGWKNGFGEFTTRLAGFAITTVVAGVVYMFYFDGYYSMRDHLMLLFGGLFFLFRGNRA
ncbi:MAG: DoxX family membrane protein [Pseudomonadota bacterium]